jgi:hypothetical protein
MKKLLLFIVLGTTCAWAMLPPKVDRVALIEFQAAAGCPKALASIEMINSLCRMGRVNDTSPEKNEFHAYLYDIVKAASLQDEGVSRFCMRFPDKIFAK